MTTPTNTERADRALETLQHYTNQVKFSPADRDNGSIDAFHENLSDLLCDLLHHARLRVIEGAPSREGDIEAACTLLDTITARACAAFEIEVREDEDR